MNCGDVCLDNGGDGYSCDDVFFGTTEPRARKAHRCCECPGTIQPGERYERSSGKYDGSMFTESTCLSCSRIRDAFVCGGYIFGELWQSIREEMFPMWETAGPIDCLAKLDDRDDRDRLRAEYEQWRTRR